MWRTTSYFIIIVLVVVSASVLSSRLWSGEQEQLPDRIAVNIDKNITVTEFGQKYHLDRKSLKKIFALASPDDLKKQVADFGMNEELLNKKVNQVRHKKEEQEHHHGHHHHHHGQPHYRHDGTPGPPGSRSYADR